MIHPPVYVVGVAMTPFGRLLDRSVKDLASSVAREAVADAGALPENVDTIFFANTTQGVLEGQNAIRAQVALWGTGFSGASMVNVENACAAGSTALHLAVNHVRGGIGDIALAVGVEKMNIPETASNLDMFAGGYDVSHPDELQRALDDIGGTHDEASGPRSIFMDIYAAVARGHMNRYGTTQRQIAAVAAKNHAHAVENPHAFFRRAMSVDEILSGRALAYPITVPMCAPITDGAAATIVCSEEGLARLTSAAPVRVLSSVLGSATERAWDDYESHIIARTSRQAYEYAGVAPGDVSVAEVHDATAFGEVLQTELLGLCELGGGGALVESGATTIGGRIPVNPSGGLESKGHPIGATGLGQIYELVQQLRGRAGSRQVADARLALAENGGGWLGREEAAAVITILERV